MRTAGISRRHILGAGTVYGSAQLLPAAAAAVALTPRAAEGPFYPTSSMRVADVDNDLVKVAGRVRRAGGEIIVLRGRLLSREGSPLAGHRIEIWQCDANGKYLHAGDDRNIVHDAGFQGFGHDLTAGDGSYWFRTIRPARYPGRTPHIHVKVLDGRRERLTTQFYVAGEVANGKDSLYRRLSRAQAQSVSMVFAQRDAIPEATVDLVI